MTAGSASPPDEARRESAAAWHVRLSSERAEDADWLAFEAWLSESPENERAYRAIETVWSELDATPEAARSNVVALKPRRSPRIEVWAGALAASFAGAVALGVSLDLAPTQEFAAPPGRQRVIALEDGSRLTLNGGSHVSVRMGRRERRVQMADAEAAFDVAKDPDRPFLIEAGDRQIRVVGTEFNVLRHAGELRVTVRHGVVEVRAADAKGPPLARLQRGQALMHREGQRVDHVAQADPDAALAWTTGRLIFRNERLADVAEVLNRYAEVPILVAPEARELRVTAVMTIDREETMVRRLSEFLPLRVERTPKAIRLSLSQADR